MNRKLLIISVLVFIFSSCSFSYDAAPYLIKGEMAIDYDTYGEESTFKFSFLNRSKKNVESFTVVFFLFDEDGNPPLMGKPNIVNKVISFIEAGEEFSSSFSLDSFFNVIPETPLLVDYLYVSAIEYEDGTVWKDPFGLKNNY
ncbi:MAG: hypothetical protein HUK25_09590 [Treponema sp.]|nr:hypothetical protein [Treponema sp.]